MRKPTALDVMNRFKASGRIGDYAIASDAIAWQSVTADCLSTVDMLVLPAAELPPVAGLDHMLGLLAGEGYTARGDYGLMVEDWDVRFEIAAGALGREAVVCATERELPIVGTGHAVRGRILRPEHFVGAMVAADTPASRFWAAMIVEEEEVDLSALADVVARHGLEEKWRRLCEVERLQPCAAAVKV